MDDVGDGDLPRVGGKAWNLARLRRQGLPVPDGFVLTAGDEALDGPGRDALLAAYGRLGGTVAVRSSSTAEDLAEASFAGQYRTVLDIRGDAAVAEATRLCLASARAAGGYAAAVGAGNLGSMAVLVQRFIEPRAAGVVFTRHPHDPTRLLIESHGGRGEALVSGKVTPDRYVLDRETGALVEGPGSGSLDPQALALLAALARRAEELLGPPQDVEWAIGAQGPAFLQARPITVEPEERPDPRVRRLTRANVGEVLPGPVTPLTWTTLGALLEHGFRAVTRLTGLLPAPDPGPFLVLHRRRLYLNLSLCTDIASRLPGISSADAERLVLGGGTTGGGPARIAPSALPGLAGVGLRLLCLARRLPRDIGAAQEAIRILPGRSEIDAADPERLALLLERFFGTGRELASTHIATSGSSAFRLALLGRLLAAWAPGDPADRVNRLVAGLEDVESAAPTTAIEALAAEAAARPDWASWLAQPPEEAARSFESGDAPVVMADRLRGFLERFGHRAVSEGELQADAWEDDLTPILDALKTLLASPRTPGFGRRACAEARRADQEAILARLGPLRRALLRRAIRGAQDGVRERERTKSLAVLLVNHGRRLARAAARHLVSTGSLHREDGVYFLTLDELVASLRGRPIPATLLERRRRRHEREGSHPAPREVDLSRGESEASAVDGPVLAGIGVSAGVGSGPARVLDPGSTPHLEPGEVLVAPVLDAALGPLLASAAAAVAEIGGMLSHGAVVARELGVPCVVDVRDATRRIRTGDRVTVDGGAGRVRAWSAETPLDRADREPDPLVAASDPADEALHPLEDHPLARESVYFNVQDPEAGLAIVSSLGLRPRGGGESLLALSLADGRVLFGLDFGAPRRSADAFAVGGTTASRNPVRLRFDGALAPHEAADFPPSPLPLALAPRTVRVSLDLSLAPSTPAIDLCQGLPEDILESLRPLGRHHVEQSGRWRGEVVVEGRRIPFDGTGSRDHSWGIRDWEAADHWRLFTVRLGDDLAVHALAVSVRGRAVEGGFLWREGRCERISRVRYAAEREEGLVRSIELEVTSAAGPPIYLRGTVHRTVTVPVELERRPGRLLAGRPYRLVLHENYTRYEGAGRVGLGMAEFTERPQ